jgi:hypothetical protein
LYQIASHCRLQGQFKVFHPRVFFFLLLIRQGEEAIKIMSSSQSFLRQRKPQANDETENELQNTPETTKQEVVWGKTPDGEGL